MKASVMQTNLTGGVWTPLLEGRIDIDKYKNALHLGVNGFVLPHGGVKMRGGTKYCGATKDSTTVTRLVPFIFDRLTAYCLEFGDYYIRFWNSDGTRVEVDGTPVEVTTPYEATDLEVLQKKQSWDVVYFTHPSFPVYKLTRTSSTSWTFERVYFQDGPYLKENIDVNKSITPSAASGSITLTATSTGLTATCGTWTDSASGTITPFVSPNLYARFRFTAPTGSKELTTVSAEVVVGGLKTSILSASLYTTSGGNPNALVDNAINTQLAKAGTVTFNFNNPTITPGNVYAILIKLNAPSATISLRGVADNADYSSDSSATPTAAWSAAATDYKMQITYTKDGNLEIFYPDHVGALFRVRHSGTTTKTTVSAQNTFTSGTALYGKFTIDLTPSTSAPWIGRIVLQKSFDGGTNYYDVASFFYSTSQEFVETKPDILYRIGCKTGDYTSGTCYVTVSQDEKWGVARITEYISTYQVRATVIIPLGGTTATAMWAEGAWSDYRGYPVTVTAHEDRFYYAGTTHQPTTIWASWVGDYETMAPGDTAESALNVTFVKLDGPIQWVDSFTAFLMGTIQEEAWVKGSQQKPITSDNIDSRVQGAVGSKPGLRPVRVESNLFHVQLQGHQVREISYTLDSDGYVSADRSAWASHLFESAIVDMAYQRDPHQLVWVVLADGTAAALSYYAAEKVMAWTQIVTDGDIESLIVLPSDMDQTSGAETVWMVVKRTVNGSDVRYIETLQNNTLITNSADYFCVDSGITYSGVSTTTITGLDHLEGETVAVLAGGVAQTSKVVSSGAITLDSAATKAQVGLPYTLKLMPMRIEVGDQSGVSQTRIKRFIDVTFRLFETIAHDGGPLYGASDTDTSLMAIEMETADQAKRTAMVDCTVGWPEGWEENGQVYLEHSSPCPCTVGSIIYTVEINS